MCHSGCPPDGSYFYPRSPCGERPIPGKQARQLHANFYPRSPCGERLPEKSESLTTYFISIHALLAESDCNRVRLSPLGPKYFYPRSPCGERQQGKVCKALANRFLSTLSLRRATVVDNIVFVPGQFLSTLSLRRATVSQCLSPHKIDDFYPRSPCGERPLE